MSRKVERGVEGQVEQDRDRGRDGIRIWAWRDCIVFEYILNMSRENEMNGQRIYE